MLAGAVVSVVDREKQRSFLMNENKDVLELLPRCQGMVFLAHKASKSTASPRRCISANFSSRSRPPPPMRLQCYVKQKTMRNDEHVRLYGVHLLELAERGPGNYDSQKHIEDHE
jgi:hypothetical protein